MRNHHPKTAAAVSLDNDNCPHKYITADKRKEVALIRKYTVISELTAPLLHELIEKSVIHQGVTSPDGFKDQEVEIFCRFIGKIEF